MATPSPAARPRWLALAVFGLIAALWAGQLRGTISSNDGSNLALARALALRQEAQLGEDAWRALKVDLAVREGRPYSDRPPGTAFAALGATWLAARTHGALEGSQAWPTASPLYENTARVRAGHPLPLATEQSRALWLGLHGIGMGLLGLFALWHTLKRLGASHMRRSLVVLALAGATAYGAYATVLFSHVSAAAGLWTALWAALESRRDGPRAQSWAALSGLCGAFAIACDYSLVLAVVPALALTLPLRRWAWGLAGATVIGAATAAYHAAAFGSVFSIGYDYSTNFAFARARASTFAGDPLAGFNTLFGWGRGAGLLVRSPIVLAGLVLALLPLPRVSPQGAEGQLAEINWPRRWLLAMSPWLLALCFHQTPWGGAGEDHRYLLAALGPAALAWGAMELPESLRTKSATRSLALVVVVSLTFASAWLFWRGFLTAYELPWISSPRLSGIVIVLLAMALGLRRLRAQPAHAPAGGQPSTRPT